MIFKELQILSDNVRFLIPRRAYLLLGCFLERDFFISQVMDHLIIKIKLHFI